MKYDAAAVFMMVGAGTPFSPPDRVLMVVSDAAVFGSVRLQTQPIL